MSKNITLYLTIPLTKKYTDQGMYFKRWLPNKTNPIIVQKYQFKLALQIDRECVLHDSDDFPDVYPETEKWGNIPIRKIKVAITIQNVSDKLADFIYDERESSFERHHGVQPTDSQYDDLNNEFKELGLKALKFTYDICNKLISYVRNQRSQYWLELISFDEKKLNSLYTHLNAKAKIEDGDLFRWNPSSIDIDMIEVLNFEFLEIDDWNQAQNFIKAGEKVNLVNELLSNSLSFLKYKHARSAVIESVTALETALEKFSRKPNLDKLDLVTDIGRIDITNLAIHVRQFGFSKSMGYLLPILYKEEVLSTKLIEKCNKAIASRNKIVHEGEDIELITAEEHVLAVKECSETLMEHTI